MHKVCSGGEEDAVSPEGTVSVRSQCAQLGLSLDVSMSQSGSNYPGVKRDFYSSEVHENLFGNPKEKEIKRYFAHFNERN